MVKYENIEVSISYRNITHYRKLGYNPVLNKSLLINTHHLPSNSHFRIDVICEICGDEYNLRYHKYIENRNRHNFYSCKSCSRQKAALTSLNKWGVDNYSKTDEYKKRVESTNLKKYGYKTNLISPEFKYKIKEILLEKYGTDKFFQINRSINSKKNKFKLIDNLENLMSYYESSESLYNNEIIEDQYLFYRNEVRRLTKKNLKSLIDSWDGLDYYDKEIIKENYKLDNKKKIRNYIRRWWIRIY